jgi:hypothetical protein
MPALGKERDSRESEEKKSDKQQNTGKQRSFRGQWEPGVFMGKFL